MRRLQQKFFTQPALSLAPQLLGKLLIVRNVQGVVSARIMETEAYCGPNDKGSHTYLADATTFGVDRAVRQFGQRFSVRDARLFTRNFTAQPGKITERTFPMFLRGGHVYTYLCYGMHTMLNIVSGEVGSGEAVLIRAVRVDGLKVSQTNGPGKVCARLGITRACNEEDVVTSQRLWIADDGYVPSNIQTAPRVGIAYAQEDALKPWRFMIQE